MQHRAILLYALTLITCASFLFSNSIYKQFATTNSYSHELSSGEYKVSLSIARPFKLQYVSKTTVRDIKISFPISAEPRGCEFVYGAAIYNHTNPPPSELKSWDFRYKNPRHLIKFKYDLKNKRCESKDLFLLENDVPESITVQFIRLSLTDTTLTETSDTLGLKILFSKDKAGLDLTVSTANIKAELPFLTSHTTYRNESFSLSEIGDYSLLVHPYIDLNQYIANEIHARIAKCKANLGCDAIYGAYAKFTDTKIISLLTEAQQVGIDVQIITNSNYRQEGELDSPATEKVEFDYSPWFWNRGSIFKDKQHGFLPMHTKFIVFGDDLVVSSNPSIRGGVRSKSREFSIAYRNKNIVSIFKEIFALVRTSLYYPVRINEQDRMQILLNADRPRSYSVSNDKPFLSIITGRHATNAYGILYNLLNSNSSSLLMAMSPITNSCASYDKRLCLYSELRRYANKNQLEMILNGYFYVGPDAMPTRKLDDKAVIHWDRNKFNQRLLRSSKLRRLSSNFDNFSPNVLIDRNRHLSTHHERAAVLGSDISILGSANWGQASIINTIEIIRNEEIAKRLRDEISTWSEPWFVTRNDSSHLPGIKFGDCEFVFEVTNKEPLMHAPLLLDSKSIRAEILNKYNYNVADFSIIEPDQSGDALDSFDNFAFLKLREKPITSETFSSPSSYLCVKERNTNRTFVVHY